MKHSENINELSAALVAFQGEAPVIQFDATVKVKTKSGSEYAFKYASFPNIKHVCQPLLKKHKLAVVQLPLKDSLVTTLIHESGQYMSGESILPIKEFMSAQDIGALITYMKRYAYSAILGLVSDEDSETILSAEKEKGKPELIPGTPMWEKAVKYIADGNSIDNITNKYVVSPTNKKLLCQPSTK